MKCEKSSSIQNNSSPLQHEIGLYQIIPLESFHVGAIHELPLPKKWIASRQGRPVGRSCKVENL